LAAGAEILLIGGRNDLVFRSPSASTLRTFLTFGSIKESASAGGAGAGAGSAGAADAGLAERADDGPPAGPRRGLAAGLDSVFVWLTLDGIEIQMARAGFHGAG
jgi:hypothetical protein